MGARIVLVVMVFIFGIAVEGRAQKPELAEIDAWLVRDLQMSSQFAVADKMGYFKEEGLKVNPRWYINGPELPSMWGAGNIPNNFQDLGVALLAGYSADSIFRSSVARLASNSTKG